jgi:hypothetical protein
MRAWIALLVLAACVLVPKALYAGVFEVSAGFSFSRSNYTEENYSWTRRWGASLGYHITESSQIELSFQDVTDRTMITGYEDTTFHDKIYAVNWVQSLLKKDVAVQPYLKAGVGQLNREATGFYASGASPPRIVDSLTGILGAGLKIHLTRGLGMRTEVSTYLTGGKLSTWEDNVSFSTGLSFYF